MRSLLLWLISVPIPIILLLGMCTHHFWRAANAQKTLLIFR
jgi:hypothetical protein